MFRAGKDFGGTETQRTLRRKERVGERKGGKEREGGRGREEEEGREEGRERKRVYNTSD